MIWYDTDIGIYKTRRLVPLGGSLEGHVDIKDLNYLRELGYRIGLDRIGQAGQDRTGQAGTPITLEWGREWR